MEKDPCLIYDRYKIKLEKVKLIVRNEGLKGLEDYTEGEG